MAKKIYKCDFNLSAWISDLEILAGSEDEVINKLNKYTVAELIEEGHVKDFDITELDITCEPSDSDYDE